MVNGSCWPATFKGRLSRRRRARSQHLNSDRSAGPASAWENRSKRNRARWIAQFRHCGNQLYYTDEVHDGWCRRLHNDVGRPSRQGPPSPATGPPWRGELHLDDPWLMRNMSRFTLGFERTTRSLAVACLLSAGLNPVAAAATPPTAVVTLTTSAGDDSVLAEHRGQWESPTGGAPKVAKEFQPPAERWLSGHRGVDLTVDWNGQIRAPADGKVTHVGTVVDRNTITIDHGDGLRSSFEPVDSDLKRGDRVHEGQVIGVLQNGNHCMFSIRACVHWGVRWGEDYVNPLQFIGAFRPSVLLPLPD